MEVELEERVLGWGSVEGEADEVVIDACLGCDCIWYNLGARKSSTGAERYNEGFEKDLSAGWELISGGEQYSFEASIYSYVCKVKVNLGSRLQLDMKYQIENIT